MLLKIRSTDCALREVILQWKRSIYLEADRTLRKMQYAIMKKKSCADFITLSGRLIKVMNEGRKADAVWILVMHFTAFQNKSYFPN